MTEERAYHLIETLKTGGVVQRRHIHSSLCWSMPIESLSILLRELVIELNTNEGESAYRWRAIKNRGMKSNNLKRNYNE